jgi:hypothetical protein
MTGNARGSLVLLAVVTIAGGGSPGVTTLGAQGRGTSTLVVGVADAGTGQPLEEAEVILYGVHRLARANALGEATIADVPYGTQHVRVRRLGYTPIEVDIAITRDTTGAVFRLQRSPVRLRAVNIEADWTPPKMKDVDVRMRQGIGRFLTEAELGHDRDRDFRFAMTTRFPGLKTIIDPDGNRVLASSRESLELSPKAGGQFGAVGGIAPCPITIYLDDVLVDGADEEMIRGWDLAVIEYYDGLQVPVRYRTRAYGCGVLLLWSKWY